MIENELPIASPLLAIVIQEDKTFTASELCLDRIEFIFATQTLTLMPIVDTDEIELTITETSNIDLCDRQECSPEFGRSMIGKPLQTLWQCENSQGYQDQIILAFGTLQPSLSILSEGSVLKVFQYQTIDRPLPTFSSKILTHS
jgi:hypothetical protein